jgi:hypothetical protein
VNPLHLIQAERSAACEGDNYLRFMRLSAGPTTGDVAHDFRRANAAYACFTDYDTGDMIDWRSVKSDSRFPLLPAKPL